MRVLFTIILHCIFIFGFVENNTNITYVVKYAQIGFFVYIKYNVVLICVYGTIPVRYL